jgi:hypothetical protein
MVTVSDEVGGYHCPAKLGPLGEGGPGDMSACMGCCGVSETRGGGLVVQSDDPRLLLRKHRGVLVSSGTSCRLQQRDNVSCGEEGRMPYPGGSDGVSCASGDRRQVTSSASGLSDRSVGDMTDGYGLGGCALQSPPGREKPS